MMKKYIQYSWPDEVSHALGDMGMIAPGDLQKQSYRLIKSRKSFILNTDCSQDRLLSIIPPLLSHLIHEEKPQIILLGHKEDLIPSSFDMREYNKYTQYRFLTSYPGTSTFKECQEISRGIDILFTTPSKLLEYIRRNVIDMNFVSSLIYQESGDFSKEEIREIREITSHLPPDCQKILYGKKHHPALSQNIESTLQSLTLKNSCTHFLTAENHFFNKEKKIVLFVQSYEDLRFWKEALKTDLVIHQFMNPASIYHAMHHFNRKGGWLIVTDAAAHYISVHCETVVHMGVSSLSSYCVHLNAIKSLKYSYIYDKQLKKEELIQTFNQPVFTISAQDYQNRFHILYELASLHPEDLSHLDHEQLITIIDYLLK